MRLCPYNNWQLAERPLAHQHDPVIPANPLLLCWALQHVVLAVEGFWKLHAMNCFSQTLMRTAHASVMIVLRQRYQCSTELWPSITCLVCYAWPNTKLQLNTSATETYHVPWDRNVTQQHVLLPVIPCHTLVRLYVTMSCKSCPTLSFVKKIWLASGSEIVLCWLWAES